MDGRSLRLVMNIFNNYMLNVLKNIYKDLLKNIYILNDEIHCDIESNNLYNFMFLLKYKNELSFKQLLDVWGIDNFRSENRFEINYNLLSLSFNIRLRVKVFIKDIFFNINSISNLYKSANWLEREVWDMFGIYFSKHNDLRRILTDYGFEGFPLRKDFPLIGFSEIYYSYKTKRIEYIPITLVKKMNLYKNTNPWI